MARRVVGGMPEEERCRVGREGGCCGGGGGGGMGGLWGWGWGKVRCDDEGVVETQECE